MTSPQPSSRVPRPPPTPGFRSAGLVVVGLLLVLVALVACAEPAAAASKQPASSTSGTTTKKGAPPGPGARHSAQHADYDGLGDEPSRKASATKPPAKAGVGTKDQSAPPSGIILQNQRQRQKEKREREFNIGAMALVTGTHYEGTNALRPYLGKERPDLEPEANTNAEEILSSQAKQDLYEEALEILKDSHIDSTSVNRALALLYDAGIAGNEHALFALGELHEFGDIIPRDLTAAAYYHNASASLGNPTAQKALGFFYDTGKGVEANRPLAFLYYEFAAQGDEVEAQITLGYKHLFGHGTRKDCGRAAEYYGAVAQRIAEEAAATGLRYGIETHRLVKSDDANSYTEEEDVVQYWKYSADSGDPIAQVTMGTLHLQGAYGLERNYDLARQYFLRAAEQGDLAAITNLGFLYAKGYGVDQNNETAIKYLVRAANQNHPHAQALLGYMYLHGMGVERNVKEAVRYFTKSADQGHSDGYLHLGNCYFYGEGVLQDYSKALQYYVAATENGHLLAHFNLAQMHRFGVGVSRNCHVGVSLYKKLVERGPVNDLLAEAYAFYESDDANGALYRYELAAEMGIELAQSNAAWLYDQGFGDSYGKDLSARQQKALHYYSMAAEQKNPFAHLKMGDFYFYGLGTDVNESKAAAYYRAASDLRDAQATFNLGYMHQHGIGLPQDLHLAKRFYDLAVEINSDAYLAWGLAMVSLGVHMMVHSLSHGEFSPAFLGLDVETCILIGLSVLLVLAILARQYAVLLHQDRRRRLDPGAHPHQD